MAVGRFGVLAVLWWAPAAVGFAATDPPGSPRAREAFEHCLKAEEAAGEEQARILARGRTLAEEAIAADERDPVGHLALFCNLGKEARTAGVSIKSLSAVQRMRREADRALELEPDYLDALVGKGAFLMRLPRVLGGSCAEGERLIRRAIELDAELLSARMELARGLAECGQDGEARSAARQALALAEKKGDAKRTAEAQALVAKLGD